TSGANFNVTDCVPLSISIFLMAQQQNARAQLNWMVANASTWSGFELQRSQSGETFSTIGTLPAETGKNNFIYFDESPFTGKSFYRVAALSFNGQKSFSNTAAIFRESLPGNFIYPTVSDGNIKLHCS